MNKKDWSSRLQQLKVVIRNPEHIEEARQVILNLHSMLFVSQMSGCSSPTFEDELWEGLTEPVLRKATNSKGRTILYGLWHSSRIEDITMSLLVAGKNQLFEEGNWRKRINSPVSHTGNSLDTREILRLSQKIDIGALQHYRAAVGRQSRAIINGLQQGELKRKIYKQNLQRIIDEQAVDNVPSANWLIDFWGRKDVAGIILMPCLRHQLIHINESMQAKSKGSRMITSP
ncbi:DinB family protein [Filimonas effusa]|uniref:DinB family protein n=1 Tax=Filimonas effusa TaxID=2508721 RepID=A0A4Q1DE67_9BACT|nr:DinB family protein [Filimonas effusa]RXK86889.1 DinB family protein [Filimonas effusa]